MQKYITEPWELWKGTTRAPLLPPTSTPATQNKRDWEGGTAPPSTPKQMCSFHSHKQSSRNCHLLLLPPVKPTQTTGIGLTSTPSHAWREGKSLLWHKLASVSTPCVIEPPGHQHCTDKQCQDDQILSELLGVNHRHFASQALTLRRAHIFAQL